MHRANTPQCDFEACAIVALKEMKTGELQELSGT
jgi:hypothetical protein